MNLDRDGRSELHYASQLKPEREQRALGERLIAGGCDINLQDARGCTPLHFASQEWSMPVASLLVERGAVVDTPDGHGNTALSTAVFNSRGRGELIEILLAAGADPDIENNHGVSPRSLADRIANYDVKQHIPRKA